MVFKNKNTSHRSGFTIVELTIVIVVIGILAAIAVVGYGAWRQQVSEDAVKSDLINVSAAMESARNTSDSGYPSSLPSGFSSSDGVQLTYGYGDQKNFCINGTSASSIDISYFITNTMKSPVKGSCDNGPLVDGRVAWASGTVAVGGQFACALNVSNVPYCWGTNSSGQLGNNSTTSSSIPVEVTMTGVLAGKQIASLAVGGNSACVLTTEGRVACWGYNSDGQLGNNSTSTSLVPVSVTMTGALNGKTVKKLAAGAKNFCVIASDDQAYCWGDGGYGQLGTGSASDSRVPIAVDTTGVLSGKTIKQIAPGQMHTCVIASDDQAYCWGRNDVGQIGNGSTSGGYEMVPVAVDTSGDLNGKSLSDITVSQASPASTCALSTDGEVYCWGSGSNGNFGKGDTASPTYVATAYSPVVAAVPGTLQGKRVDKISTGSPTLCLISSGTVYCTGAGSGMIGNGSSARQYSPTAITITGDLNGKYANTISVGTNSVCMSANGDIFCWGNGGRGQLGDGGDASGANRYSYVPSLVVSP